MGRATCRYDFPFEIITQGFEAMEGYLRPAHSMPEEFENAALFLRSGLPFTLIRHENGAFQKRSSNQKL